VSTAFFTALSYVFGRAVDRSINPETVTFFWFFGAFVVALVASALIPEQRRELRSLHKYLKIFILSSLVTAVGAAFWIFSLRTIGLPLTSFLMKSQTLFSLFLGMVFLDERLTRWESVGVALTILGGVVVAYQRDVNLILGTGAAILAAFCYSSLSFLVKRFAQNLNMLTVANLRAFGVALAAFMYLIATGRFQVPHHPLDVVYMALGGVTGAYIAKASQFQSIKLLDVSRSTAVLPMESLFVVWFSYALFHELPSATKLVGGAAIVGGVVLLVIFRGRQADVLGK
ncbi:MAG: DMT family transporter, partial [Candidatus Methanosuratincola sp.]